MLPRPEFGKARRTDCHHGLFSPSSISSLCLDTTNVSSFDDAIHHSSTDFSGYDYTGLIVSASFKAFQLSSPEFQWMAGLYTISNLQMPVKTWQ